MSTYVGKLLTSISSALEFNTATLSGAIDIVVIEDDTGRRQCSPFHVRFGKLQLLKSRGIPVNVELNGSPTTLTMLLGAAGEAYFYSPSLRQPQSHLPPPNSSPLPDPSFTSPTSTPNHPLSAHPADTHSKPSSSSDLLEHLIPAVPQTPHSKLSLHAHTHHQSQWTSQQLTSDYSFAYTSDSEVELTRNEREGTSEVVDEPRSPPINSYQRKWNSVVVQNYDVTPPPDHSLISPTSTQNTDEHPRSATSSFDRFPTNDTCTPSDTALQSHPNSVTASNPPPNTNHEQLPAKPQSDQHVTLSYSMTDVVGEEDARMECRSIDEQEEDHTIEALQERVAGIFPEPSKSVDHNTIVDLQNTHTDEESPADSGSLRASFFEKLHFPFEGVRDASQDDELLSMSMCGRLLSSNMKEDEILELFDRHRVSFSEFEAQPSLLFDPALIVKIENKLVDFRAAAAFVFALLSFRQKVDIDKLTTLLAEKKENEPAKSSPTPSRRFGWFGWSSPPVQGVPLLQQDDLDVLEAIPPSTDKTDTHENNEDDANSRIEVSSFTQMETELKDNVELEGLGNDSGKEGNKNELSGELTNFNSERGKEQPFPFHESMTNEEVSFSEIDPEALSLRPSEAELQQLDLKPGANEVRFIVQSSSVELSCRIFLWNCHTKIFISDVDGTITRSDVLGHLLPAVGRDWSQVGVAGLYTQIEKNGYKVLYLTARPIGQASQTRSFLHNVTQGSAKLPNGPVLMSPNRLVESFTREVIHRKPHEFKITALREIRSLFPPDYNPFHAGFGNRDSDIISYRAVGLIPQRIFVVNPKGELVVTNARYESTASYSSLQALVESVFPDISRQSGLDKVQAVTESASFNDWNFWKGKLPDIDIDAMLAEGAEIG